MPRNKNRSPSGGNKEHAVNVDDPRYDLSFSSRNPNFEIQIGTLFSPFPYPFFLPPSTTNTFNHVHTYSDIKRKNVNILKRVENANLEILVYSRTARTN